MNQIDARVVLMAVLAGATTFASGAFGGSVAVVLALAAGAITARCAFGAEEPVVIAAILTGGLVLATTLDDGRIPAALAALCLFIGTELAAVGRVFVDDPHLPWRTPLLRTARLVGAAAVLMALVLAISSLRVGPAIAATAGVVLLAIAGATLVATARRGARGGAR